MCTSEAYMLRHFVELSSAGKPAGGRGMVVPPPRRPLPHCDATAKYINTASAIIICHGSQKCYVCMYVVLCRPRKYEGGRLHRIEKPRNPRFLIDIDNVFVDDCTGGVFTCVLQWSRLHQWF